MRSLSLVLLGMCMGGSIMGLLIYVSGDHWCQGSTNGPSSLWVENSSINSNVHDRRSHLDVVLARYREPLNWLEDYLEEDAAFRSMRWFIYQATDNRTAAEPLSFADRRNVLVRSLENRGREAHAYLQHIIDRYDELAPLTVFAQGWPFDAGYSSKSHPQNFGDLLRCLRVNVTFATLSFTWHQGHHLLEEFEQQIRGMWASPTLAAELPRLPGDSSPLPIVGRYCCAQFAVSRARIRAHSRQFYRDLLQMVLDPAVVERSRKPLGRDWGAFMLENLWHLVLGGEPWLAENHDDRHWCPVFRAGCGPCTRMEMEHGFLCGEQWNNDGWSAQDASVRSANQFCRRRRK